MREKTLEERVRINALLQGTTDGHTYSMRTAEPPNPADGSLMYFEAGVVGNAEGFYGKGGGEWKLIPQVTVQPGALWDIKTAGGSTYLHPIDLTTHMLVGSENMPTALNLDIANEKLAIAGTPLTNEGDLQALGSGVLALKETTTPTADADHAKVYSKSDNKFYYQDGAGVEHELVDSAHTIVSHDTTGTGAEVTELTDGSETTLHSHAAGASGAYRRITMHCGEWVRWGTFGLSQIGTSIWTGVYGNSDRFCGVKSLLPLGWSNNDVAVNVTYVPNGDGDDSTWRLGFWWDAKEQDSEAVGSGTDASVDVDHADGDTQYDILDKTITIAAAGLSAGDVLALKFGRHKTHGNDDCSDGMWFSMIEIYNV